MEWFVFGDINKMSHKCNKCSKPLAEPKCYYCVKDDLLFCQKCEMSNPCTDLCFTFLTAKKNTHYHYKIINPFK